jgi:phage-related protein
MAAAMSYHADFLSFIPSYSVLIIVPLLISSLIIRIIHSSPKLLHIIHPIIPLVLNILRNILYVLHLLARPARRILWEIFNVVDRIIKSILDAIVKVLDPQRSGESWRCRCRIRRRGSPCGICLGPNLALGSCD